MRKILLAFTMLFVGVVSAQEIKWMTMNEAFEAQKQKPKKIFIDFYTPWCGPCKMLTKVTFANKDVANYINKNFYAVKFNAEGNEEVTFKKNTYKNPKYDPQRANTRNSIHQFTEAMGVRAYPTMMILNEKSEIIMPIQGYLSASQIEPMLKFVGENAYLNVKTQQEYEAYMQKFKGSFKD